MDNESLSFMFTDIRNRLERLNDWEIGFVGDIEDKFLKGYQLTTKQLEALNEIYERATENG